MHWPPHSSNLRLPVNTLHFGFNLFFLCLSVCEHSHSKLRINNAVDFDDLLGLSVALLKREDVCSFYNDKFKTILVDEFQVWIEKLRQSVYHALMHVCLHLL